MVEYFRLQHTELFALLIFMLQTYTFPLVHGFIQAETPNLLSHDVYLSEFPVFAQTSRDTKEELPMIVHGQKFTCQLSRVNLHDNSGTEAYNQSADLEEAILNITAMPCIWRVDMYWTYAVCVGTHVKQSHQGKGYILGYSAKNNDPKFVVSKNNRVYFVQHYTGGSECDLTGYQRTTEVRFICANGSNQIHSVIEVETCHYLIEVYTPSACIRFEKAISQTTMCSPDSSGFAFADMFGWTTGLSLSNRNLDRDFEFVLRVRDPKDSEYLYFSKFAKLSSVSDKLLDKMGRSEFDEMLQKSRPIVTAEFLLRLDHHAAYYHSGSYNESDVEPAVESGDRYNVEISHLKGDIHRRTQLLTALVIQEFERNIGMEIKAKENIFKNTTRAKFKA